MRGIKNLISPIERREETKRILKYKVTDIQITNRTKGPVKS